MTALLEYLDLTALLEYIDLSGIQGALHRASWGPFQAGAWGIAPPPPPLWAALATLHGLPPPMYLYSQWQINFPAVWHIPNVIPLKTIRSLPNCNLTGQLSFSHFCNAEQDGWEESLLLLLTYVPHHFHASTT